MPRKGLIAITFWQIFGKVLLCYEELPKDTGRLMHFTHFQSATFFVSERVFDLILGFAKEYTGTGWFHLQKVSINI